MRTTELKILVASALLFLTASAQALQPEVLYAFQAEGPTNVNGANPEAGLVQGSDGSFYGTTYGGGGSGAGTVFKVTTNGVLTILVSFNGTNGAGPYSGLLLDSDDNFYGTTSQGGSSGWGTVFKVSTNGILTMLVSFNIANGAYPETGLVLGLDGNLYGTTPLGGTTPWDGSGGTVYKVTTSGVLTSLFSFDNGSGTYTNTHGSSPTGGLVFGNDGNIYGTTGVGGSSGRGTVFKLTTNGVLTILVSFTGDNGANPLAGLVLGSDGNFYGTTSGGGTSNAGTVFKVTTDGVLTSLVSFAGNEFDPQHPSSALVLGNDGAFYGTTPQGDKYVGTVFRVTTNGVLTTLAKFSGSSGTGPNELVLGLDGNFYGTTRYGGPGGGGTIFRLVISAFTRVARQSNGSVLLTGTGPLNGGYRLWASPDVSLPVSSWTLLTSASFDSNGNFSFTDASAATNASRFYQLSVP